jgi:preprotein translocase SecE subunit
VLALIGRWLGGLLEGWVYDAGWFSGNEAMVGGIIAIVIVGLLALWVLRTFFRPGFENWLVRFEEQGWFSGKAFKPGQGMRVRRGTILGILLLAGSGIWVLINHGILGAGNWELNIPFTGKFVVDDMGDAGSALANTPPRQYQVVDPGSAKDLEAGMTLSSGRAEEVNKNEIGPLAETKKKALDALIARLLQQALDKASVQKPSVKTLADLEAALNAPKESAQRVTDPEVARLVGWIQELKRFDPLLEPSEAGVKLFNVQREIDRLVRVEKEHEKERQRVSKDSAGASSSDAVTLIVKWADSNRLPILAPVLDRFRVRDINADLDPLTHRIIVSAGDDTPLPFRDLRDEAAWFPKGKIVDQREFEEKVEAIKKQLKAQGDTGVDVEDLAKKAAPPTKPMEGHVVYASITLLPAVRFTIPLLLLFLTIWLAWRVVNLPTFGDFLIATEAELNKVSWTTRARLWQDTLVVLTTMLLMALFLFVVDIAWAKILSWKPIGVLQVKQSTEKPKDEANLKW